MPSASTIEFGTDRGKGNLLAVQPELRPADYALPARWAAVLDGCLAGAQRRGWLNARTVAVFPEYLGAWLVVMGEPASVYGAPTIRQAMRAMALRHLPRFLAALCAAREPDRARAALFRLKAPAMAACYTATFARLARQYQCTVVAGSIILPAPHMADGVVTCASGPLRNVSACFAPDGRVQGLVAKSFLTGDEHPFLHGAPIEELPAFDTPAGRLGILLCADAWYPASYARLKALGVELIAVPAYATRPWTQSWPGYDGAPTPADVDPQDIHRLSEGDAWYKYALPGRLPTSGARAGLTAFLRGQFWELGADGHALGRIGDEVVQGADGAGLVNLWL